MLSHFRFPFSRLKSPIEHKPKRIEYEQSAIDHLFSCIARRDKLGKQFKTVNHFHQNSGYFRSVFFSFLFSLPAEYSRFIFNQPKDIHLDILMKIQIPYTHPVYTHVCLCVHICECKQIEQIEFSSTINMLTAIWFSICLGWFDIGKKSTEIIDRKRIKKNTQHGIVNVEFDEFCKFFIEMHACSHRLFRTQLSPNLQKAIRFATEREKNKLL